MPPPVPSTLPPSPPTNNKATRSAWSGPIQSVEEDRLGRLPIARTLYNAIVKAPQGWSTRLGLFGPWGEGKTSVLRLLADLLQAESTDHGKSIVVVVSAWNAADESAVLEELHESLFAAFDELERTCESKADLTTQFDLVWRRVSRRLRHHRDKVSSVVGAMVGKTLAAVTVGPLTATVNSAAPAIGEMAKKGTAQAIDWAVGTSDKHVQGLADTLKSAYGISRVVIFIDDLDRADPRAIPRTLLALHELLDWPDFAFVLAFDRQVVSDALCEYSQAVGPRARAFLDKIIDVAIELPDPPLQLVERFALEEMSKLCVFIPIGVRQGVARLFPVNPRRIRAIVRELALLGDLGNRVGADEIHWHGLVLQVMFRHWAPRPLWQWLEERWLGYRFGRGDESGSFVEYEKTFLADLKRKMARCKDDLGDIHNQSRLIDLALALLAARRPWAPDVWKQEMAKIFNPPPITQLEFDRFRETARAQSSWAPVVAMCLRAAQERSAFSETEAAAELLALAVNWHERARRDKANAGVAHEVEAANLEAEHSLSLLEFLWSDTTLEGIRLARPLVEVGARLLRHLGLLKDPHERERQLAEAVLSYCQDYPGMLEAAIPTFVRNDNPNEPLLKFMAPGLFRWMLNALQAPDGMEIALAGEQSRRLLVGWLFGSPASPLFDEVHRLELLTTLKAMRSGPSEAARWNAAQNAGRLLGRLNPSEGGSWAHGQRRFFEGNDDFFREAWATYTCVEMVGARIDGAISRRSVLVKSGVREKLLEPPSWMTPHLSLPQAEQQNDGDR